VSEYQYLNNNNIRWFSAADLSDYTTGCNDPSDGVAWPFNILTFALNALIKYKLFSQIRLYAFDSLLNPKYSTIFSEVLGGTTWRKVM
jgi:hypothetical protein